jgi:hypothetical protein
MIYRVKTRKWRCPTSVWPEKVHLPCVTVRGDPEDRPKIASEGHFRWILAVPVRETTFLPDFGAAANDDRLPNHADRCCLGRPEACRLRSRTSAERSLALVVLLGNQQFAQDVKVAAQHTHRHITLKPRLAVIATAL